MDSAPLKMKPIQTPASVRNQWAGASVYRRSSSSSESSSKQFQSNLYTNMVKSNDDTKQIFVTKALSDSNFDTLVENLSDKLRMNQAQTSGGLSTSNSADLLSISPIFGKPFDALSVDDSLITPADDDLIRGIRNINYDIDFSDSPENSLAEEIAEIRKYSSIVGDFSKEESSSIPRRDLEEFDPLIIKAKKKDVFSEETNATRSLIDESPNDLLLENPLSPLVITGYQGFTSQTSRIQSINCETGNQPLNQK